MPSTGGCLTKSWIQKMLSSVKVYWLLFRLCTGPSHWTSWRLLQKIGDSRRLPFSARGEGQCQHYNRSWIVAISTKPTGKRHVGGLLHQTEMLRSSFSLSYLLDQTISREKRKVESSASNPSLRRDKGCCVGEGGWAVAGRRGQLDTCD